MDERTAALKAKQDALQLAKANAIEHAHGLSPDAILKAAADEAADAYARSQAANEAAAAVAVAAAEAAEGAGAVNHADMDIDGAAATAHVPATVAHIPSAAVTAAVSSTAAPASTCFNAHVAASFDVTMQAHDCSST